MNGWKIRTRLSPGLLLLVAGCGPYHWDDPRPVSPPVEALGWWQQLEACSGLTGDFFAVRWYTVPGSLLNINGRLYDGYWIQKQNAVVYPEVHFGIAAQRAHIIRHELLHALLGRAGHPAEYFARRCRSLVRKPR